MRRRGRWIALATMLVLWSAVAPATAGAERVIVAFGDSLTAGYGVPPAEAYPALLGARLWPYLLPLLTK